MPIEIERKFLVVGDDWRTAAHDVVPMAQGYLNDLAVVDSGAQKAGARTHRGRASVPEHQVAPCRPYPAGVRISDAGRGGAGAAGPVRRGPGREAPPSLIILHVEFKLPYLPRVFFQDIR